MTAAIGESVRSLNEAAQAMRDGQSKLVEVTSAIIQQMNQALGENSKRLRDETDDAVRRVVEHIANAAGGFSSKIGGASQDVAAALLSEAKVLAHPASIDNVPTDGGKEDHVSMGMTAATKLRSIVDNAELITAIELITAAEGLEYRAPLQPGRGVKQAYNIVRAHVPRLTADRAMSHEIQEIAAAIRNGEFDSAG